VKLRPVEDSDLDAFFAHQADREAARVADVPSRDRAAFDVHWARIRADRRIVIRTIEVDGQVAGNLLSFIHEGMQVVGYWVGREWWGRGVATAALAEFLEVVDARPLHATVAHGNAASVRVLEKNGFRLLREQPQSLLFELR
jgi:RimJ/RimL family protein N-acetyltransferase